jgi:hypothetical protein
VGTATARLSTFARAVPGDKEARVPYRPIGAPMNTRTIAILALVIVVIVVIVLFVV